MDWQSAENWLLIELSRPELVALSLCAEPPAAETVISVVRQRQRVLGSSD
jgi:hypothetical protein